MARRMTDVYNSATHTPAAAPSPVLVPSSRPEDLLAVQQRVVAAWADAGAHSEQTLARMGETTRRFARRLQAQGVASFSDVSPGHARGFVHAPVAGGTAPEIATQHARRTAIRTLYRTLRLLGYPVADPTLDLALPPRGLTVARPLTDDEVTLALGPAPVEAPIVVDGAVYVNSVTTEGDPVLLSSEGVQVEVGGGPVQGVAKVHWSLLVVTSSDRYGAQSTYGHKLGLWTPSTDEFRPLDVQLADGVRIGAVAVNTEVRADS